MGKMQGTKTKRYGQLGVIVADRTHVCHLKDKCVIGSLIDKGEPHFNLLSTKIMPTGGMIAPESNPDTYEDRIGEDGVTIDTISAQRRPVVLKTKFITSRFHFICLKEWGEYIAQWRLSIEVKKGRKPDPEIDSLPPEVKRLRRRLSQMRSVALGQAIKSTTSLGELQALLKAQHLRKQINDIGVPLRSQGISSPALTTVITSHACDATNRTELHKLGEDYHCINCNKCYSEGHIHT